MAVPAEATHIQPQPPSVTTLHTIVDLVRRITHADVASIVSFSMADETITWKAISGFRAHTLDDLHPFVHPQATGIVKKALAEGSVGIFQGIGSRDEFPAESFPVTAAEGVCDLAMAPLRIQANHSGALIAGYRSRHNFTDDEKRVLQDLAEMGALVLANSQLVDTVSAAEELWERTFDAIGEGILVYDDQMRIVRGNADWPSFQVRYKLAGGGQELKQGEERIADLNYTGHISSYGTREPLRYEKQMLDGWFKARFSAPQ